MSGTILLKPQQIEAGLLAGYIPLGIYESMFFVFVIWMNFKTFAV